MFKVQYLWNSWAEKIGVNANLIALTSASNTTINSVILPTGVF